MSQAPISAERVRAILDAYGSAPQRWPDDERDAARALIAADPGLRADLAAARDLDATLALHPPPPVLTINPLAVAAAARAASALQHGQGVAQTRSSFWPRTASLAAAAVLGFAIGVTGIGRGPAPLDPEDALALMIMIEEESL